MPAGQARPRRTRGGDSRYATTGMRTWNTGADLTKPRCGQYSANPWGFFDMHGMCGSGRRTGTQHTVREHRLILRAGDGLQPCLSGRLLGRAGTALRSADRDTPHPSTRNNIGFRVGFQQQ